MHQRLSKWLMRCQRNDMKEINTTDWMNQWANDSMNQWINASVKRWTDESMNQQIRESTSEWMSEPMSHEPMHHGISEPLSQWIKKSIEAMNQLSQWVRKTISSEPSNQWTNDFMNQWINEPMNQWINEPMNQWTNEEVNPWINAWTNEWMDEWLDGWIDDKWATSLSSYFFTEWLLRCGTSCQLYTVHLLWATSYMGYQYFFSDPFLLSCSFCSQILLPAQCVLQSLPHSANAVALCSKTTFRAALATRLATSSCNPAQQENSSITHAFLRAALPMRFLAARCKPA